MAKRKWDKTSDWSNSDWGHGDRNNCIHGVDVQFVCNGVPVLSLDNHSVFQEHVSMMLQTALDASEKADSLYEYCTDSDIMRECRALGFRSDDVLLARMKREGLRDVRAVGTTKRAVMLALVMGIARRKKAMLKELWRFLDSYDMFEPFTEVLDLSEEIMSKAAKGRNWEREPSRASWGLSSPASEPPALAPLDSSKEVDVCIVSGNVPVLSLDKLSTFWENSRWLLQTALSSDGKADALYEYCNDRAIMEECCCRLGLSKDEVSIARLTRPELRDVKAVGTTGKRSTMLALVVALVLQGRVQAAHVLGALSGYDSALEGPFLELLRAAGAGPGRGLPERGGRAGGRGGEPRRGEPLRGEPRGGEPPRGEPPRGEPERELRAPRRPRRAARAASPAAPPGEEPRARGGPARRPEAPEAPVAVEAPEAPEAPETRRPASTDDKPLEGSCTEVERPYYRTTALPRASDVRPVPVLRQAFALVSGKWAEAQDWVYASEMLRSIRQDLTVQMVRDAFAVEVYEFCARAALEFGDFKVFEQCSAQLEELYDEVGARGADLPGHVVEFLAYRLLWLTLQGERLALVTFRRRHAGTLRGAEDPDLRLALALCSALESGNTLRACRLAAGAGGSGGARPGGPGAAMRRLLELAQGGLRLQILAATCAAHHKGRPAVLRESLLRLLRAAAPAAGDDEALRGLPLVWAGEPPGLDGRATAEAARQLLSKAGPGARRRLGDRSSDHMKGFVRASHRPEACQAA